MESRVHFVRQSIHLVTHIAPETLRAGPLACYAQWMLETAIGNLGREIRQDRDLYMNLTQRAILRAQVNSLRACYPTVALDLSHSAGSTPPFGAREFDECKGYFFLPRCEEEPSPLGDDELHALQICWREERWPNSGSWVNVISHWSKLQLPNGQRARSLWYESRCFAKTRHTTCMEVSHILQTSYNLLLIFLCRYHTKAVFELQKCNFTFA